MNLFKCFFLVFTVVFLVSCGETSTKQIPEDFDGDNINMTDYEGKISPDKSGEDFDDNGKNETDNEQSDEYSYEDSDEDSDEIIEYPDGCTPYTKSEACDAKGFDCGTVNDGCGGYIDCGTCGTGECVDNKCECETRSYTKCHNGDVWWFDSCDKPEIVVAECTHGCTGNTCTDCVEDCTGRECGPGPLCGDVCGACSGTETCSDNGICGEWCKTGETKCHSDGFSYLACGAETVDSSGYTWGSRVPCFLGDNCDNSKKMCERSSCLESEIIFLLDRSSSMVQINAWGWVRSSLSSVLSSIESRNFIGFRQFPAPGGDGCGVSSVVAPKKNNRNDIMNSITDPDTMGSTPIESALVDLVPFFGDPNDGQAVILITDGEETCTTEKGAIDAAAFLHRRGIPVYVIAVTQIANKTMLDSLARAGGTNSSYLINTSAEFETALNEIILKIESCTCNPGTIKCTNGKRYQCNAKGSGWDHLENCALNICQNSTSCAICSPLSKRCKDGFMEECNTSGSAWVKKDECSGKECKDSNTCYHCEADAQKCENGKEYLCSTSRMSWSISEVCESGYCADDEYCSTEPGDRLWTYEHANIESHIVPAVRSDGTIFVPARIGTDNYIAAVNPDGTEKWKRKSTDNAVFGQPVIYNETTLYVPQPLANRFVAIDADTGSFKWTVSGSGSTLAVDSAGSVYYFTSRIFYAVNPDGTQRCSTWLNTNPPAASTPSIAADGKIYFATQRTSPEVGGRFFSMNTSTCAQIWAHLPHWVSNSSGTPVQAVIRKDGKIYFHMGKDLYSMNTDNTRNWRSEIGETRDKGNTVDENNVAYVPVFAKLNVVKPDDGTTIWTKTFSNWIVQAPTLGDDGTVYALLSTGVLQILNREDGSFLRSYTGLGPKIVFSPDGKRIYTTTNKKLVAHIHNEKLCTKSPWPKQFKDLANTSSIQ